VDRRIYLTLIVTLLSACTNEPSATPTLTLSRIVTSPAHETLVTNLIEEFPMTSASLIDILILPPQEVENAVRDGVAELAITGAIPPDGWFATPLLEEGIAVIVHPENRVRSYTLEDLAAVFSGQVKNWSDLGGGNQAIQPIIALSTDEVRVRFDTLILGDLKPAVNALLAPSPSAMSREISEDPAAIGYIPLSELSAQVHAAHVDGIHPSDKSVLDGSYPLSITVFAIAQNEPDDNLRDWLAWIQSVQGSSAEVRGGTPP
jgi:hypothetical protein